MKQSRIHFLLCLGCSVFLGCGGRTVEVTVADLEELEVPADIRDWSTGFKDLTLVTPKPVVVNPELARLCRGAEESEVEAARVEYGPHAHGTVTIYMNPGAVSAFDSGGGYPIGAVVVKEKWLGWYWEKDSRNEAGGTKGVGGMVKREAGYDAENGDWEYFYADENEALRSGRLKTCVDCHAKAKGTDYVFGSWAGEGRASY